MDLCYKQKGTDLVFRLGVGEHAHLHWTDTTRLLHCIVANNRVLRYEFEFMITHMSSFCKCILQISMHTLEANTNLCQEMSINLLLSS